MSFLAILMQMGLDITDTLNDYWSTLEQFYTLFYSNKMKFHQFIHILSQHFTDTMNQPDKNDNNYDKLWKTPLFDEQNSSVPSAKSSYAQFHVLEFII
jgi:hypothetical protein